MRDYCTVTLSAPWAIIRGWCDGLATTVGSFAEAVAG